MLRRNRNPALAVLSGVAASSRDSASVRFGKKAAMFGAAPAFSMPTQPTLQKSEAFTPFCGSKGGGINLSAAHDKA